MSAIRKMEAVGIFVSTLLVLTNASAEVATDCPVMEQVVLVIG